MEQPVFHSSTLPCVGHELRIKCYSESVNHRIGSHVQANIIGMIHSSESLRIVTTQYHVIYKRFFDTADTDFR